MLWLLAAAPAFAGGSASVSLQPQRLAIGEVTQLTVEIARNDLGSFHLEPRFSLDNLQIVGGPAQRESMSWVNGTLSRTLGMTWYLAPQHPGRARVYGVKLLIDGKVLPLPDQEAQVDAAGATAAGGTGTAPPPADEDDQGGVGAGAPSPSDPFRLLFPDLFRRAQPSDRAAEPQVLLRAELTPASSWAGQQLVYTLYLLVERRPMGEGRVSVETIFPRRVPAFRGFWSQEIQLPESGRAEVVQLGDRLFWRQAILQRALFPYEPGSHRIESAEADLRLVYFRPLGFGLGEEPIRPGPLRRDSNEVSVQVRPLPPAPPGFHGAIGRLRVRAQLGQPQTPAGAPAASQPSTIRVRAGEGVALTEELSGSGNLAGLPDPALPLLPGVQISPPQESTQQKVDGTQVESTRTWVWTLVPTRAGEWRLPPQQVVSFDPGSGKYVTLETAPQALVAGPPAPTPPPVSAAGATAEASSRWRVPLLWAAGGAGAALALLGAGWLVARLRRRDAAARRRLLSGVAAALENGHQPRQAASAAESAWRSFLGDRFALPPETPPQQWPRLLAARGLQPRLAGELVRLVDDIHYLRYAPQLASTDALQRDVLERSRRLARRLA